MIQRLLAVTFAFCVVFAGVARADEGMWTFDNFPSSTVQAKYGFKPSQAWLDHVRQSALRIAGGCTASFVSPSGLIMTNHHCAVECADANSTAAHNYVNEGYYAKTEADEFKCPGFEIDQLQTITNVTPQMMAATKGKSGTQLTAAIRAENAQLQKACATVATIRCDVVSLYHGGVYDLYKYRRYRDIRLAFIPEFGVAQFGGDPDNFNFPRFDFDVAFIRAYDDNKPASTPQYFKWSKNGSKDGDLVFVPGNPGSTSRQLTVSQLEYLRDNSYPFVLPYLAEERGELQQYGREGAEQARTSRDDVFYIANSFKAITGEEQALQDPQFFGKLVSAEDKIRAQVNARPSLRQYAGAWNQLAALQQRKAQLAMISRFKSGLNSPYYGFAVNLVRVFEEKAKPNAQRLPEYSDAALVTFEENLLDPTPIYPAEDEVKLAYQLDQMRRMFGPDDAFVKIALDNRSPVDQAHYLDSNTKLGDPNYRKQLYEGGQKAVDASTDPFIVLARKLDAMTRANRKLVEDQVTNPERVLSEEVAKAKFGVTGTKVYPDATFTLRLSYGTVKGYSDYRGNFGPYTTMAGLYARANGADPYVLPQSWLDAKSSVNLSTPMNLSTTNDIIGGNSGSALINKNAEIVGLIFDGNIESLGGAFGFDPRENRSVAVDSRALIEGLRHVYHADRIVTELGQ